MVEFNDRRTTPIWEQDDSSNHCSGSTNGKPCYKEGTKEFTFNGISLNLCPEHFETATQKSKSLPKPASTRQSKPKTTKSSAPKTKRAAGQSQDAVEESEPVSPALAKARQLFAKEFNISPKTTPKSLPVSSEDALTVVSVNRGCGKTHEWIKDPKTGKRIPKPGGKLCRGCKRGMTTEIKNPWRTVKSSAFSSDAGGDFLRVGDSRSLDEPTGDTTDDSSATRILSITDQPGLRVPKGTHVYKNHPEWAGLPVSNQSHLEVLHERRTPQQLQSLLNEMMGKKRARDKRPEKKKKYDDQARVFDQISAANVAGFTELKQKASEFDNGPGRAVVKPVYDDPFADKLTEIKTKQNPSMTEGASVRLDVLPYRFVRNAAYKPYKKSNKKRPGKRRKS